MLPHACVCGVNSAGCSPRLASRRCWLPTTTATRSGWETRFGSFEPGGLVQHGLVDEVFSRPSSLAAAGIVAVETIQHGQVMGVEDDLVTVAVGGAQLTAFDSDFSTATRQVYVCIRAEDVVVMKGAVASSSARNRLSGRVTSITREGLLLRIGIDCGFPLTALLTRQASEELGLTPGDAVLALVKAPHIHLIARS